MALPQAPALGDRLLLVLPVPFRRMADGRLFCESQAANGLDQWSKHFSHVTVVAPVIGETGELNNGTVEWRDPVTLRNPDRLTLVPLPTAYAPRAFLAAFMLGRRTLQQHIDSNRYLQFGIGGLIGDWAALGACLARLRSRTYSIHTDRVEHELIYKLALDRSPSRRFKARLIGHLTRAYHRCIIRGCALGLWHGRDCYLAYSPWARENHLIHDLHLKPTDAIPSTDLEAKKVTADSRRLRIVYAGRMDPMKAPMDWLHALRAAADLGVDFEAVWLGDGPLHMEFQACLDRLGLRHLVRAPGFVDRATLLQELRRAHLFVFTHVTRESPRCLLEALVSGSPLAGYSSAYAEDLTADRGGGVFVPTGQFQILGREIAALDADRPRLIRLIGLAAENGKRFNDDAVFKERSDLIRRYS